MRLTPIHITELPTNHIFVFGSNLAGRHGAGAAKQALSWGAVYGNPRGLQGQTYAIPTKDERIATLPVDRIRDFVDQFADFARNRPDLTFLVTEIGCGLAGYKPEDIAPLFIEAAVLKNVYLPERFWAVISQYVYVGHGYVELRKTKNEQ